MNKSGSSSNSSVRASGSSSSTRHNNHQADEVNFLSAVELEVFHKAVSNYKIHGKFLTDDAIALHWTFGGLIMQVLEMVDQTDTVKVMKSSTSNKVLVRVYGSGTDIYWIPMGKCVCQCIGYLMGKKDYCKHILAAHVMLALYKEDEYEEIAESEMKIIFDLNILGKK